MLDTKDFFNQDSVLVWRFQDAPGELKALSTNGGDEDWVALVPDQSFDYTPAWINALGVCDVDVYEYEGMKVYIGSHA